MHTIHTLQKNRVISESCDIARFVEKKGRPVRRTIIKCDNQRIYNELNQLMQSAEQNTYNKNNGNSPQLCSAMRYYAAPRIQDALLDCASPSSKN